jgi:hypothetical protein
MHLPFLHVSFVSQGQLPPQLSSQLAPAPVGPLHLGTHAPRVQTLPWNGLE